LNNTANRYTFGHQLLGLTLRVKLWLIMKTSPDKCVHEFAKSAINRIVSEKD